MLSALRLQRQEDKQTKDNEDVTLNVEFDAFRSDGNTALDFLRRRSSKLAFLRSPTLPWYLVLGTESSGKTSLLKNGFSITLYESQSADSPACFSVTDNAVLVECTSTIIKDNNARTSRLWEGMLEQLPKWRRAQVNGIIVLVDVAFLLNEHEETIKAAATTMRERLNATMIALSVDLPVYLLVSKLDLLVGCDEFFDALKEQKHGGILGIPYNNIQKNTNAANQMAIAEGFKKLSKRIETYQLLGLQKETDVAHRCRIFEFPSQFTLLQLRLLPFLQTFTGAHRFADVPNLRGLFFTSSGRTAHHIDSISPSLAKNYYGQHVELVKTEKVEKLRTRPLFIADLFRDVILADAYKKPLDRLTRITGRFRNVIIGSLVFCIIAIIAFVAFTSIQNGHQFLERTNTTIKTIDTEINHITNNKDHPTELDQSIRVINRLKDLANAEPAPSTFNFYSTNPINTAADLAYKKSLQNLLLPVVENYLIEEINKPETPPYLRLQQLKFYLILGGRHASDPTTAAAIAADFSDKNIKDTSPQEVDPAIADNLAAMSASLSEPISVDEALVKKARQQILEYGLTKLAFDMILDMPEIQNIQKWRPVDYMGSDGLQALSRASGDSFWKNIPGLYTTEGINGPVQKAAATTSQNLVADLWAMGTGDFIRDHDFIHIRNGILNTYLANYIKQWSTLISGIGPKTDGTPQDTADAFTITASKASPLKQLLVSIAAQVGQKEVDKKTTISDVAASASHLRPVSKATRLSKIVRLPEQLPVQASVTQSVSDYFHDFREAVIAPGDQQTQIDSMLSAMQPLSKMLNYVANGDSVSEMGKDPKVLFDAVSEQNANMPLLLKPVFERFLKSSMSIINDSSHQNLEQVWDATILPLCVDTVENRYPFDSSSKIDTSLKDFNRIFSPKGMIAAFQEKYLAPLVDMTTVPWQWQTELKDNPHFNAETLAAFEHASTITEFFFADQDNPSLTFTIVPQSLSDDAQSFVLNVDDQYLNYSHGPTIPIISKWPSANSAAGASLSVIPEIPGGQNAISREGPWAFFRLLDTFKETGKTSDAITYLAKVGSRNVKLKVTLPAIDGDTPRKLLRGFSCPQL